MKFKQFIPAIIFMLALFIVGTAQAQQPTGRSEEEPELDAVVEKAMRRHDVPGGSVAVLANGAVIWAKGYGMANLEAGTAVTADTVFEAASVSKSLVAWGIMNLVEDGLLDLDVPVEQYLTRWHLPPSEYDHDQVTLRRILSHTAGLSTDGDPGVEPGKAVPTLEEALSGSVAGMDALHVAFPPGEAFHYSSIGYALLELIAEEVTGEPFASYLQREILDPLGMTHSSYEWTPALRTQAAVGHDWYNNPLSENIYATRAPGGLLTTAPDLARFMAAFTPGANGEPIGRGVLKPETVAETLAAVTFTSEADSPHPTGLGYDLLFVDGVQLGAQKTGDNRGYKSIIVMALEQGEGIAILANGDRAQIGFIFEVACGWSKTVSGNPLQETCQVMSMIHTVQIAVAVALALGALVYIAFLVRAVRNGRRQITWHVSWGKGIRIGVLLAVTAAWWILWYTDTLFTNILGVFPDMMAAVTVRILIPWPTAFVWVSWAVTLWLLAWIAAGFVPKVRERYKAPIMA